MLCEWVRVFSDDVAGVTLEVHVMEVPHDESNSVGIEVEIDADRAQTLESQSSDRIAESNVAEETMSALVRLAKDPLELHDIDQPTAECQLMTPSEGRLVPKRGMSSDPCRAEKKTPRSLS